MHPKSWTAFGGAYHFRESCFLYALPRSYSAALRLISPSGGELDRKNFITGSDARTLPDAQKT